MSKGKNASRRAERAQAFQVLYGLSFSTDATMRDVRRAFLSFPTTRNWNRWRTKASCPRRPALPGSSCKGSGRAGELDQHLARFSRNWRVDRMGRVERTILRLAMYELLYRQDVPARGRHQRGAGSYPASSGRTMPPLS